MLLIQTRTKTYPMILMQFSTWYAGLWFGADNPLDHLSVSMSQDSDRPYGHFRTDNYFFHQQGVSWLVRKAIRAASMKLTVTFRSESMEFVMHTMLTGGLTGSSETRIPDWVERLHKDNIFGDVLVRCRFVPGELDAGGNKWPQFDMQSTFYREPDRIEAEEFLKNFTSSVVPAQEKEGRKDSFLHDFVRNESAGWTAEQVYVESPYY